MQNPYTLEDVTNGPLRRQSIDEVSRIMVMHRFNGTISGVVQLTVVHRQVDFAMLNANASVVTQVIAQTVRQLHPRLEEVQPNVFGRPQCMHYRSQAVHRLIQFLVRAEEAILTAYLATIVLTRD